MRWLFNVKHPVCLAVRCSVLQRVTRRRSVRQCVAVRCSVLQCVAMCCSVLQCVVKTWPSLMSSTRFVSRSPLFGIKVCCSALQYVAVRSSRFGPNHIAVYCIALQFATVCFSMFLCVPSASDQDVLQFRVCCSYSVLRCVAVTVCCSVLQLQCVAVCCG